MLSSGPLLDVLGTPSAADQQSNLDNAATTPALACVVARVLELLPWYGSINRGAGVRARVSSDAYEGSRATVHRLVGARADQAVIFTRNTTDGLNKVARLLLHQHSKRAVVLTTASEHHANLLPWRWMDYRHVRLLEDGSPDVDHLASLLDSLHGRVRLVALSGASNVTGHVPDIAVWSRLTHDAGAELCVDAAQLAPHRALELAALGIDHCAFSGHKLFAPFGSGVLISPVRFLESGPPDVWGGGATASVSLEDIEWNCAPEREEAGTPNVLGAVALATALEHLHEVGFDVLATHERGLGSAVLAALSAAPEVVTPSRATGDRVGVFPFAVPGRDPHELAEALGAGGVAIRAGKFCAHPLVRHLRGSMGLEPDGGLLRVSLAGSTGMREITRFATALGELLQAPDATIPERSRTRKEERA
jgi:cysteine desulfurase / selenocysteine lyase